MPEGLRALPVDNQSSVDAIMTALHRAGLDSHRFTGIQTTDEWALVPASLLALHLGCDFLDPVTAVHFRDKSLQKGRVRAAGLKVAQVTVIDDIYDVSGIDELPYPKAVLKPVAGAADHPHLGHRQRGGPACAQRGLPAGEDRGADLRP